MSKVPTETTAVRDRASSLYEALSASDLSGLSSIEKSSDGESVLNFVNDLKIRLLYLGLVIDGKLPVSLLECSLSKRVEQDAYINSEIADIIEKEVLVQERRSSIKIASSNDTK